MINKLIALSSKLSIFLFGMFFVGNVNAGDTKLYQNVPAGIVKIPLNVRAETAKIAFTPDNKLIVSAAISKNQVFESMLLRFTPGGKLDPAFGDAGIVTTKADGTYASITSLVPRSLLVQGDGKIILAGEASASKMYSDDFLLMRYLSNGQLDKSFDGRGWVVTGLGKSHDQAHDVTVLSDGKIVLVGGSLQRYALVSARYDFAVARYLPNGLLDQNFANKGKAIFRVGSTSEDFAYAVKHDQQDRVIVAGKLHKRYASDIALIRVNKNGKLDKTFGENGVVSKRFDELSSSADTISIQHDNKILVAGGLWHPSSGGVVLRYDESGQLDNKFGVGGVVKIPWVSSVNVIKHLPNGKIVIFGTRSTTSQSWAAMVVTQLNHDGTLDTSFGVNGTTSVELGEHLTGSGMVISKNGEIFVCGNAGHIFQDPAKNQNNGLILFKLNQQGVIDKSFGT